MADLNNLISPFFLNDKEIRKVIELIFFSYRDFTAGPDKILEKLNFGRAHHRVIYFVGKKNNITIKELLRVLKITKQSLQGLKRNALFGVHAQVSFPTLISHPHHSETNSRTSLKYSNWNSREFEPV